MKARYERKRERERERERERDREGSGKKQRALLSYRDDQVDLEYPSLRPGITLVNPIYNLIYPTFKLQDEPLSLPKWI